MVDKGRPVRLGNMSFTWEAPSEDMGDIKVVASIAYRDAYVVVESDEIRFNNYPVRDRYKLNLGQWQLST